MAGIGFKLQKLFVKDEYISIFHGFIFSLIITSGPWLIMVISLSLLSILSAVFLDIEDRLLFNILLVHIFAITIIITGTFQLFFTRIFADMMFSKKREQLSVIIMSNLALAVLISSVISIPFISFIEIDFTVKALTYCFFITMTTIWILLNYVSGSEEFLGFIKHYVVGAILGLLLGVALGKQFGFSGFYFGFLLGQIYIAILLIVHTIKIYGFPERIDLSLLVKFSQYKVLIFSGFFLYFGMWVDKFIYWYSPTGEYIYSFLYYHPNYNDIFYFAFLFTSPIMAIFFITMETSFYLKYFAFNKAINNKASLYDLAKLKDEVIASVRQQLWNIAKIQGLIILIGIIYAKEVLALLNMSEELVLLLDIILVGAFFHMFLLIVCILLLYFDLRVATLKIYGAFLFLNCVLTLITVEFGDPYYGLGYTIAAIVVFLYALSQLKLGLNELNFLSFTRHAMAEENIEDIYLKDSDSYGRYYIKEGKDLIIP